MRSKRDIILAILIFVLGFTVSELRSAVIDSMTPDDLPSPSDHITEDRIHVYNDSVYLDIEGVQWSSFTDTKSMEPILDYNSNALQIIPQSPDEIHIGDIVSYQTPRTERKVGNSLIIHRVIEIGTDSKGWYAITKGDNLKRPDPDKVRFSQIRKVLFAIIY